MILLHLLFVGGQHAFFAATCTTSGDLPAWTCGTPFEPVGTIFARAEQPSVLDLVKNVDNVLQAIWQAFIMNYEVLRLEQPILNFFGWCVRLFVMAIGAIALATAGLSLLGLFRSFLPI